MDIISTLDSILNKFQPISLKDMDTVKLMDRVDTKFIFNSKQLPEILGLLESQYNILEIKNKRINKYETSYLDTEELNFYLDHHNKKLNRHKVRFRRYVDSDLNYIEVKFKTNKGRTIKQRLPVEELSRTLNGEEKAFVEQQLNMDSNLLQTKLWIYYSRITLIDLEKTERLTIDLDLRFQNSNQEISLPAVNILELKQQKRSLRTGAGKVLRDLKIKPLSISKYCTGIVFLYNRIKYNQFKSNILKIQKISNGVIN